MTITKQEVILALIAVALWLIWLWGVGVVG